MAKQRLDMVMVERELAESRSAAQRLVMAGQVRVNGEMPLKPSFLVSEDAQIEVDRGPMFVSRGGEKLKAALDSFAVNVREKVCADVGASTGGFTDCLLQHGARRVYAIDVGKGILHWKLRQDPKVVVMEGVNARYLETLPERIQIATIDASFISLKNLLPAVGGWLSDPLSASPHSDARTDPEQNSIIALVKPQFEAGRAEAARGDGVIRDPLIHRKVLIEILGFAEQRGFRLKGLIRSPLLGPKGNVEFLAWLEMEEQKLDIKNQKLESFIDLLFQ